MWSTSGANYNLGCGWINVGTWCLRSEIYTAGTSVRNRGVRGCDVRRKGGSTARTRLKIGFSVTAHFRFRLSLAAPPRHNKNLSQSLFLFRPRTEGLVRMTLLVWPPVSPSLVFLLQLLLLCPGPTPCPYVEQNPPRTHFPFDLQHQLVDAEIGLGAFVGG